VVMSLGLDWEMEIRIRMGIETGQTMKQKMMMAREAGSGSLLLPLLEDRWLCLLRLGPQERTIEIRSLQ